MCFRPAELQMNKCSECGTVNRPIDKECKKCGAALSMTQPDVACPLCGAMNSPTATQCVQCGATDTEIIAASMKAPQAPVAPVAPKAPSVPKAPGAPKPPAAPGAPTVPPRA